MTGRVNKTKRPVPGLHMRQWRAIRYTQLAPQQPPSRLVELGVVEAPSLREACILAARAWPAWARSSIRYPKGRVLLCEVRP